MKQQRQHAILDLVRRERLGSQRAILERLRELGFRVTQSTISRDLEELGLARMRDGEGRTRYVPPGEVQPPPRLSLLRHLLREFAGEVQASGSLAVVKTPPGAAQAVASAIDQAELNEVIGTVAGDDTILVVSAEGVRGRTVARRLRRLMEAEE